MKYIWETITRNFIPIQLNTNPIIQCSPSPARKSSYKNNHEHIYIYIYRTKKEKTVGSPWEREGSSATKRRKRETTANMLYVINGFYYISIKLRIRLYWWQLRKTNLYFDYNAFLFWDYKYMSLSYWLWGTTTGPT